MHKGVKIALGIGAVGGVVLAVKGIVGMYRKRNLAVPSPSEEEMRYHEQASKFAETLGGDKAGFMSRYHEVFDEIKSVQDEGQRSELIECLVGSMVLRNDPNQTHNPQFQTQAREWIQEAKSRLTACFGSLRVEESVVRKAQWLMDVLLAETALIRRAG